jgi:hypothetical protein
MVAIADRDIIKHKKGRPMGGPSACFEWLRYSPNSERFQLIRSPSVVLLEDEDEELL